MSNRDRGTRRRQRRAHAQMPTVPAQQPPQTPVMPRGGNGVPTRPRRVQDALVGRQAQSAPVDEIPVQPGQRPRARSHGNTHMQPTDALASAVQQMSQVLEDGLGGLEEVLEDLLQVSRIGAGLDEADEELEKLRGDNENLRVENAHLNNQLAALHAKLEQIRNLAPTVPMPGAQVVGVPMPTPDPPTAAASAPEASTDEPESTDDSQ